MPSTRKASGKSSPAKKPPSGAEAKVTRKDALTLLKEDHRKVEALFEEFESARKPERKQAIVQMICDELTLHAALEETAFYPAVREALTLKKDQDLLDEATVEHASLKWLIAQLQADAPDQDFYDAKVTVLKEYVSHHVKEEEKQMFPKVRDSSLDTAGLGETLQVAKDKLKDKLKH